MGEPMMHINVPPQEYLEQFYNKCHGDDGRFCSDEGGKSSLKGRYGEEDTSEGLGWSMDQGQNLNPDPRFNQVGQKTPRWEPENERQAEALDRLKSVPTAGDQSPPGKSPNKDWISTQGSYVDKRGKEDFDEDRAKALIDEGRTDSYYTDSISPDSIIPSEDYVKRNAVAETIHQTDNPTGPYARPGYLPMVVQDDRSDGYLLVNGNHRVEAAHYLQEPFIDVNVFDPEAIRKER